MSTPIPSIGRIVHYTLTEQDAAAINRRRKDADEHFGERPQDGTQVHTGNTAHGGQTYPMLITCTWGDEPSSPVNGQVFLDGNDVLWVCSRIVGNGPGYFTWPIR